MQVSATTRARLERSEAGSFLQGTVVPAVRGPRTRRQLWSHHGSRYRREAPAHRLASGDDQGARARSRRLSHARYRVFCFAPSPLLVSGAKNGAGFASALFFLTSDSKRPRGWACAAGGGRRNRSVISSSDATGRPIAPLRRIGHPIRRPVLPSTPIVSPLRRRLHFGEAPGSQFFVTRLIDVDGTSLGAAASDCTPSRD